MFTVYVEPLEQPADSVYSLGQALPCACCMLLRAARHHGPAWLVVQAGHWPGWQGRAGPVGCVAVFYNEFSAILGHLFPSTKHSGC
jgi:hypothetical protein